MLRGPCFLPPAAQMQVRVWPQEPLDPEVTWKIDARCRVWPGSQSNQAAAAEAGRLDLGWNTMVYGHVTFHVHPVQPDLTDTHGKGTSHSREGECEGGVGARS